MPPNPVPRYCGCGTRLARDNTGTRCAACVRRVHRGQGPGQGPAPAVPAEFWTRARIRAALRSGHLGHLIAAYRHHPFHGRTLQQAIVAGWVGLTQAQLSRIEHGPPVRDLDRLDLWATTLGLPAHLRWFRAGPPPFPPASTPEREPAGAPEPTPATEQPANRALDPDVNRRELLRLLSTAAAALSAAQVTALLDPDRITPRPTGPHDPRTVEHLALVNTGLWTAFTTAPDKAAVFPAVRGHLDRLTTALRRPQPVAVRKRLAGLTADTFQLAGEVFFDANQYSEAAHCYTLAATASRDADAMDLWACAMTRHAYISVYEQNFTHALPLLDLAAALAARGDTALSTRHWVEAVRAQALAGVGDLPGSQRALDAAENVHALGPYPHTGGWLRFDGSRLPEDRGACYVQLGRPDLAEPVLTEVARSTPPGRRRGVALVDLATVGALRRDPLQIVTHATAALDLAQRTHSGVVIRKLRSLRPYLADHRTDRHVQHLAAIGQLRTTRA